MHELKDITLVELESVFTNRNDIEILIPKKTLDLEKQSPNTDFSIFNEISVNNAVIRIQDLATANNCVSLEGKHTYIVLYTYAYGGKIEYKKLENGDFNAKVSWPVTVTTAIPVA